MPCGRSRIVFLIVAATAWMLPVALGQVYEFTTLAGRLPAGAGEGQFARLAGLAVDRAGVVYATDTETHSVYRIEGSGAIRVLAGGGGSGSADGMGAFARFSYPRGIAVDAQGNVFVADTENSTIRKITPTGLVTTVAGVAGRTGDVDGPASEARFDRPYAIAVDGAGNLFVLDGLSLHDRLRRIDLNGNVTTLPGIAGGVELPPAGGNPLRTRYESLAVDADGRVYICELLAEEINFLSHGLTEKPVGARIVKLARDGARSVLAGSLAAMGNADGAGEAARFGHVLGLAVGPDGNLAAIDGTVVRRITAEGAVTTLAGQVDVRGDRDGVGLAALFNWPVGLAFDRAGNIYVADTNVSVLGRDLVRRLAPDGSVTTFAGTTAAPPRDGVGGAARFEFPHGIVVDDASNLIVGDSVRFGSLREISAAGAVVTLPLVDGSGGSVVALLTSLSPAGLVRDAGGNLFVSDTSRILHVTPAGVVTLYAGASGPGAGLGSADGTRSEARFFAPAGLALDEAGNLFIADRGNHTIRKISAAGVVSTLSGVAGSPGSADGVGTEARFFSPAGVAADRAGNIYVSDTGNSTLRRIAPDGRVTTIAGAVGSAGSVDGRGDAVRFEEPQGLALDARGNLFVADRTTIRKVTPEGLVSTVGGWGGQPGNRDGTGSGARFADASDIAIDRAGTLYLVDFANQSIRKGVPVENPARVVNVSVLAALTGAGDSLTLGTIVGGSDPGGTMPLLVRAAGPSLVAFGVADPLADPQFEVYSGTTRVGANDNWDGEADLAAAFVRVGAFPWANARSQDAALRVAAVPDGNCTVRVSGRTSAGGTVLAELYDDTAATPDAPARSRLTNVSVLKNVSATLTAGFMIDGASSVTVLIRAVGPSLAALGLNDVQADPQLTLFDGRSRVLAANDDWGSAGSLARDELTAAFARVSAFPFISGASQDAALLINLAPGNYTVQLPARESHPGLALLEIYEVR
jgi:sugar lactone lactonase YvrE